MAEILLLEDDPLLGKSIEVSLKQQNYVVTWVQNIEGAGKAFHNHPFDLIVADVNLPDGSGFEFVARLREQGSKIPVLILTARTDEASVVKGFESGANDYVRKPFSHKELLLRLRVLLHEKNPMEHEFIHLGSLKVNLSSRQVSVGDIDVSLNRREFDILARLAQSPGGVVQRTDIIDSLNTGSDIFDRTIDSHVSHIRARFKQLGILEIRIESVYGIGYRLQVDAPA
jgi:DNA-binding response OmpR family regulator